MQNLRCNYHCKMRKIHTSTAIQRALPADKKAMPMY